MFSSLLSILLLSGNECNWNQMSASVILPTNQKLLWVTCAFGFPRSVRPNKIRSHHISFIYIAQNQNHIPPVGFTIWMVSVILHSREEKLAVLKKKNPSQGKKLKDTSWWTAEEGQTCNWCRMYRTEQQIGVLSVDPGGQIDVGKEKPWAAVLSWSSPWILFWSGLHPLQMVIWLSLLVWNISNINRWKIFFKLALIPVEMTGPLW